MRESLNVAKYVFIALGVVAFIAGFLFKEGKIGKRAAIPRETPLIKLDSYLKPVDPAVIGYKEIDRIDLALKKPTAMAVSDADIVSVAGDSQILIFKNKDKKFLKIFIDAPAGCMTFAPNGQLFIGMTDHVQVFSDAGENLGSWGKFNDAASLTSIAATGDDVFAADAGNKIIWHCAPDGTVLGKIGERDVAREKYGFFIPGPFFDVAIGYEGLLWAVNPGRLALENYAFDGSLRSSWSKISVDVDGFCGCCNPTHMAILPDGAFVTAEKGIPRVKIHDQTGALRTVVAAPTSFAEDAIIADIAIDSQQRILVLDQTARAVRIFAKK